MPNNIIVVGSGWAGLSAAIRLAERGIQVTVLEAAPQAGGRARSVSFPPDTIDNGQHLLLGAYQHTLQLFSVLGIPEHSAFLRTPLRFLIKNLQSQKAIDLKIHSLPSPFHLLTAMLTSKGLSSRERLAVVRFFRTLLSNSFHLEYDISVKTLLENHNQPRSLIEGVWGPIAVAALSTPIHIASAEVFLKILKDSFSQRAQNSDYLFPIADLSQLFPNPASRYLTERGSKIAYHQRVEHLLIENNRCIGVQTASTIWKGESIILAIPPDKTVPLLETHPLLSPTAQVLSNIRYQPITTVYIRFKEAIRLPRFMMGTVGGISQWIFDRRCAGQPNIMSIVITGDTSAITENKTTLYTQVLQEVQALFPSLPPPIAHKIICEKKAAFSCEVGINQIRPKTETSVQGLYLAGDYTQTGYPGTLEGAMQSGIHAAQQILFRRSIFRSNQLK